MNAAQQVKAFLGIREWHKVTLLSGGHAKYYRVDFCTGDVDSCNVKMIEGDTVYGNWMWLSRDGVTADFGARFWIDEMLQDMFGI